MAQTTAEKKTSPAQTQEPKTNARRKDEAVTKAKDSVSNAYESVRDAGTEAIGRAQSAGEAALSTSTDMVRGAHSELDDVVRRNPTLAIVGALGLGVLLGLTLRARN